ncbi:MAG: single-stranded DNA-binding protein [Bacteroidota bacterium]
MAGVNKAILIGNLGRDPEIRHLEDGTVKASFSIATSKAYTDRTGEKITKTEWHNIVLWRGLATIAERYLQKGKQVYIEGEITNRSYEDKSGNTRYISEIVGDKMVLLGNRNDVGGDPYGGTTRSQEKAAPVSPAEDELPF